MKRGRREGEREEGWKEMGGGGRSRETIRSVDGGGRDKERQGREMGAVGEMGER